MNSLKLRRLAERITKINRLNNKLYSNLGISVPKYILDEIIDGGDKDNIIALIGLAKINVSAAISSAFSLKYEPISAKLCPQ